MFLDCQPEFESSTIMNWYICFDSSLKEVSLSNPSEREDTLTLILAQTMSYKAKLTTTLQEIFIEIHTYYLKYNSNNP